MLFRIIPVMILTLIALTACERQQDEPTLVKQAKPTQETVTAKIKPATLLKEPIVISLGETATAALGQWREFADTKPALVLFSNTPFLQPIPKNLEDNIIQLILEGSADEIKRQTVDITTNPTLLHHMAVDAALRANLFSELLWVIPHNEKGPPAKLSIVKNNLLALGKISQSEHDSLTEQDGIMLGRLRDIPTRICFSSKIPEISAPSYAHFDLSYFRPFYKNEISTPIYSVIFTELAKIREKQLPVFGATVSYSNLGGELPLSIRFLGGDLATILSGPETINEGIPRVWALRGENLYLENFFRKEMISENLQTMNEIAPDDAAVKYQSYQYNAGQKALDYLAQAVALDPIYALEYLELSSIAMDKGRPDAALTMLEYAQNTFPDNPIITMTMVDLSLKTAQKERALTLIKNLKERTWSEVYDPDMPSRLERMATAAEQLNPVHAPERDQ